MDILLYIIVVIVFIVVLLLPYWTRNMEDEINTDEMDGQPLLKYRSYEENKED